MPYDIINFYSPSNHVFQKTEVLQQNDDMLICFWRHSTAKNGDCATEWWQLYMSLAALYVGCPKYIKPCIFRVFWKYGDMFVDILQSCCELDFLAGGIPCTALNPYHLVNVHNSIYLRRIHCKNSSLRSSMLNMAVYPVCSGFCFVFLSFIPGAFPMLSKNIIFGLHLEF